MYTCQSGTRSSAGEGGFYQKRRECHRNKTRILQQRKR